MHGAFTPQAAACVLRQSNDIQPRHDPQNQEFGHLPQPLPNTAWLRDPALWQQQRHACAALAGHAGDVFAVDVTHVCSGKPRLCKTQEGLLRGHGQQLGSFM